MNSKFYLFLAFSLVSQAAFAQPSAETLALFPDLYAKPAPEKGADTTVTEKEPAAQNEKTEVSVVEESIPEIPTTEELFQIEEKKEDKKVDNTPAQEEEDDKEEQAIFITLDNINATLPPNRNAAFCSAAFKVVNLAKKPLKRFSGTFTIGKMTEDFEFNNLAKGQAVGEGYFFAGPSCEKILDPLEYEVQVCEIEGVSEKKCKAMVQYIKMPQK